MTLVPDSVRLTHIGERARFQVRLGRDPELRSGGVVKWSSTDTAVFTVDADGEVTARGNGLAELVAELKPHVLDRAPVRVEQRAAVLEVVGGGQSAGAGLALPEPVGVRLFDEGGTVVTWPTRVRFEVAGGGGAADPAEAVSDSAGVAWTVWTVGAVPGPRVLSAAVEDGPGGEIGATALPRDADVVLLVAHAGDGQWASAGGTLAEPVVVRVVGAAGERVPGATVRFEPAEGHGTVDPAEAVSDIEGLAAAVWTLAESPRIQTLAASAGADVSAEFTAWALSDEGVCGRTPVVADEIMRHLDVADCAAVTETHLAGIGWLRLDGRGIRTLQSGDFAGLSGMRWVSLDFNELAALPPDLFEGLPALESVGLINNRLAELPSGIFAGLPSFRRLFLSYNALETLSPDAFQGLPGLSELGLAGNGLKELPPGIFAGLSAMRHLHLNHNGLESLPAGVFADMPDLRVLRLEGNRLPSLPPGIFDGLGRLEQLEMEGAGDITELPPGIFDDLEQLAELNMGGFFLDELPPAVFAGTPNLEELLLDRTDLAELRPDVFAGLHRLRYLELRNNELAALPPRVFAGLGALETLFVHNNPGAPFPVVAEFERTDAGDVLAPGPARVVMRVPSGAPFAFRMPVSVQGGAASAGWFEAAAGDTASAALVVERPAGSTGPAHLSFGQPPGLPPTYFGIEVVAGSQIALFAESDNRTPVFRAQLPAHWMPAGGGAVGLELAPHFEDPDGDALVYGVESSDGSVAGGRIDGGVLWMEPLAEGEAALVVTASDPGGLMASQRMTVTVAPPPDPDRLNIHLVFDPGFTEEQKGLMRRAAARWEEVVVGDLPDVPIPGYRENCGHDNGRRLAGTVDDVVIEVYPNSKGFGDNPLAGRCGERDGTGHAFHGGVWFADFFLRSTQLDAFYKAALHEIGHVLGFGGDAWDRIERSRGADRADPYFPGPLAVKAFNDAGGLAYDGRRVPLHVGSTSHWRTSVLTGDVMTTNGGRPLISAVTVQALADIGLVVDLAKADPFTLPLASGPPPEGAAADRTPGEEAVLAGCILRLPVTVVDENGRIVRVIRILNRSPPRTL